jgi:hypothetical protein
MEDTGIRDSSCVISMEQTNHRISQEWVAQRLLMLLVPSYTAPQLVTTGCLLASDAQFRLILFIILDCADNRCSSPSCRGAELSAAMRAHHMELVIMHVLACLNSV